MQSACSKIPTLLYVSRKAGREKIKKFEEIAASSKEELTVASYFEIGGEILDGSYGYNHRKFRRLRRAVERNQPVVVADIVANLLFDSITEISTVEDVPYSDMQLAARKWGEKWQRRIGRILAPLPLAGPVKVAAGTAPTMAIMWSKGVGTYDLQTPEVRRYEESVYFGGSGGRII